jgi:amino acid transporter
MFDFVWIWARRGLTGIAGILIVALAVFVYRYLGETGVFQKIGEIGAYVFLAVCAIFIIFHLGYMIGRFLGWEKD